MLARIFTLGVLILGLLILPGSAALAHSGEPRLEIGAERLPPGAVLDVRGVNFEPEEEIQLALVGTETDLPIVAVTADPQGIFIYVMTLPLDLAEGIYSLRATTDDHEIFSPQLTISGIGAFVPSENDGDQREEEDGLLAPMPTFPPATTAANSPTLTSAASIPAASHTLASPAETSSNYASFFTRPVVIAMVFFILSAVIVIGRRAMVSRD